MKIWCISDTHFFHENIKKYENRPEGFEKTVIANWNKLVKYDDLIIHLGDVLMGLNSADNCKSIMATLPGKKILCRGNHDVEKKWGTGVGFMERGFDVAVDYFVYDRYAFSHCPLTPLPYQSPQKYKEQVILNIHGHFHRKDPTSDGGNFQPGYYDPKYFWNNKSKYINVSHMFEDELRPFELEEVIQMWLDREKPKDICERG